LIPTAHNEIFNVGYHHSIGAYSGMRTNLHRSQNLCAGSNDLASNLGNSFGIVASEGYLMKDRAIHAKLYVRMNVPPFGGRSTPPANLTCERDISAGNDTPKTMAYDEQFED
jgi:hypothetical protein